MADILIRGMEMPKNCVECPCFSQWDDCGINHEWKFSDEFDKTKDRLPSCPLLPLPEWHGRLGDLDKLEESLRMMAAYQTGERQQGILGCCETIRMAKSIVPAEGGGEDGN